jgi:hypothetical protein
VPPTHTVHPQPLEHGRQTIDLHESHLEQLLTFCKLDDDEKDAFVQWIALLGDGKTTEFYSKIVEAQDKEDRVLTLLGLFHEYMTAQKGVGSIAVDLGGTEQLNAIGRTTPYAQQAVSRSCSVILTGCV